MTPSSNKLPNIVLIIMDSATAKRCSVYGHHRDTTPGLRRIAQEGSLYRYCFAPACWTLPSHASLFSGLYPSAHGCYKYDKSLILPEVIRSLPEILGQMGYQTVALSSNSLVSLERGFDDIHYLNFLFNSSRFHQGRMEIESFKKVTKNDFKRFIFLMKYSYRNKYLAFPLMNFINRFYQKKWGNISWASHFATERTLQIAKRLFSPKRRSRPLFLFMNFMETHWRFNPPSGYNNIVKLNKHEKKRLLAFRQFEYYLTKISPADIEITKLLYEQELYFLDNRLLNFYRFIQENGLLDNTLFIITADHGECFGEHQLWSHTFGLYNELIHIPLIIKYPSRFQVSGEFSGLTQLQDIFATIVEITGAPFPIPESSQSLLGEAREVALAEHLDTSLGIVSCQGQNSEFQPSEKMQPCRCIIDADLQKLIEWRDGRLELYDLKTDFAEQYNLVGQPKYANCVRDLYQKLEAISGKDVFQSE
jgi:arylsulfatase A-like enzyme